MQDRARVGVIATALLAVSPFQIGYGSEARMYATLQVVGVAAALLGDRWLRKPTRWHAPMMSLVLVIGLFDHVSAFLLVPGLFVLAGVRSDRDAWRWRAWIVGALAVWAVGWGWAFAQQRTAAGVNRIPPTTVARFLDAVSNSVTFTNGVVLVVVLAVGVGAVLLCRDDRVLGRVWLGLGLLPYALGAVLGLFVHFFMDRTFSVAAWAPVLAIAWLADRALRRSMLTRAVVAVALVILVVPGTVAFLRGTWGFGVSTDRVAARARAGDVVAIVPKWYGHLIDWEIGVHGPAGSHPTAVHGVANAAGVVVGDRRTGHRTWLVTLASNADRYDEFPRCAPDDVHGSERLLCLVTPG